jgi:hypothetical protein
LLGLAALGCGSTGSKPAYWQTVGAINYPFVQVSQTGAQVPMRTLDLRLEDGVLKVGRETPDSGTADAGAPAAGTVPLQITEATCTADELARGRALMSADLVTAYQQASETVTGDQRKARFVVVPAKSPTSLTFTASADAPSTAFADLLSYIAELIARYQP